MEAYIYQTILILNGSPRYLDEHVAILNRWSLELFERGYVVDINKLSKSIKDIVTKERCINSLSAFVCLKLAASGESELTFDGTSLYKGYALRSIEHTASTCKHDVSKINSPTSVRKATTTFSLAQVQSKGITCIIQHNDNNLIISANDSPFFAIKGDIVYTPPAEQSVERMNAISAIQMSQMQLIEQEISIDQLPLFDELFIFDHIGITSISYCDGEPYTSITVENIAAVLHKLLL